ncbi:hypothetical protein VNI00_008736 [Paramarasmius palmivorus]|uniref:Heterokaryon incompatibility domain-containing protein n=1 Tax=Paramarasmius palmivorus TaxID=297713 RepID=A0AAW0CVU7_9AGAR
MQKSAHSPAGVDIQDSLPELPSAFSRATPERSAIERLFVEDPGVKGCGWFHRRREDPLHVLANVIRVACNIVFGPLLCFPIFSAVGHVAYNFSKATWQDELVDVSSAVLRHPPLGDDVNPQVLSPAAILHAANGSNSNSSTLPRVDREIYEKTNFEPRWMLRVFIRDGHYDGHEQIQWTEEHRGKGYTALSYDMDAAYTLFKEAGRTLRDPPPPDGKAKFSLRDRKRISLEFLAEYCSAARQNQKVDPDREVFVWLDEFCLSRERQHLSEQTQDDQAEREEVKKERSEELGRLSDIFRAAETVVVFCNEVNCDHTNLTCRWANRLFTLGEILHANKTQRMTRRLVPGGNTRPQSHLYPESGRSFRERMMHAAALASKWYLHSVLQQSNSTGNDTWQMTIHALIVEAIRRDRESGYDNHEYLGKGLNGLFPRRARLHHLKGKDGWADLAWLLEVNQGFYNQAALAAVCCLPDKPEAGNGWLGPPIEPRAGNERFEPLVTAFTVRTMDKNGKPLAPLNIVGAKTIGLHPDLKRDSKALFRNPHVRIVKIVSVTLLLLSWFISLPMIFGGLVDPGLMAGGLVLLWTSSIAFNLLRLIVSTMYLERSGWVFLSEGKWNDGSKGDAAWGSQPEHILGQLDRSLKGRIVDWGEEQMAPRWDVPTSRYMRGHLVDLRTGIKVRVVVSKRPNAMVVLGVHGCGVTYMLLNRSDNVNDVAGKVGLANLPPFTLAVTNKCGSVRVGIADFVEPPKPVGWGAVGAAVAVGAVLGSV